MSMPMNRFRPKPSYTRIEGLSSTLRLPRLGKIRLGVKVKKRDRDNRCKHPDAELCLYCSYPKDVDYFVVPPEVQEIYGESPKELDVLIPCESQEMFFPQSLKCYRGNRLWCRGDGKEATRINMDTGEMTTRDCPCEHYHGNEHPADPKCFEKAHLMVLLPKISMGGAWQVDTGSVTNIIEINSTIEWLRGMIGRIAFVPLKLKRVPRQMQVTEAGGKVRTVTKALLKLEFEGDIMKIAALRQADIISIEGGTAPKALIPPRPVDDGDDAAPGAIVVEEEPFGEEEAPAAVIPPSDAAPGEAGGESPASTPQTEEEDDSAAIGEGEETPVTNIDVVRAYILGAQSTQEALSRFKDRVQSNADLKHDEKLALQDVLNKRLKDLKAGRR